MSERGEWEVTTHDWSQDLDVPHLSAIRADPERYAAGGRRHLILEVLAYANEEAEALGRVGRAIVETHGDGSVTVSDDGRGTDTRRDAAGHVVRKPVMATPDVRFASEADDGERLPDGLLRRGMSAVSALSAVLVHENHRTDGAWSQTYRYGVPDTELLALRAARGTGTAVTFRPGDAVEGPSALTAADLTAFRWLRVEVRDGAT